MERPIGILKNTFVAKSKLLEDTIEIWDIDLSEDLFLKFEPYFYILDDIEKVRANNFKVDWNRKVYILARTILRLLVSNYIDVKPRMIQFYKSTYGKPFIKPNELKFNISHSRKKLAIIISKDEVGIDVEYVNPNFKFFEVLDIVLSKNEILSVQELEPKLQRKQFFLYWTQKEALLKAIGTGINLDLNALEACPNPITYNSYESFRFEDWIIFPLKNYYTNYVGHAAYKYHSRKNIRYLHSIDFLLSCHC